MAIRPCKAWNTPTMIIMIAANMMNPTAQPLVCRPAREYASLLMPIPPRSQRTTDRTMAPTEDADITPFWDELCAHHLVAQPCQKLPRNCARGWPGLQEAV